jgi:hypothetical protein
VRPSANAEPQTRPSKDVAIILTKLYGVGGQAKPLFCFPRLVGRPTLIATFRLAEGRLCQRRRVGGVVGRKGRTEVAQSFGKTILGELVFELLRPQQQIVSTKLIADWCFSRLISASS